MWYLIIAFLLGLGNPSTTNPDNGTGTVQTASDGGDEGETSTPRPPRPKKP